MRRWAAAVAGLLTLAPAGCAAAPEGVDGDLTDGWKPMPAATRFSPQSGTCHPDLVETGTAGNYAPVPCAGPHVVETIAVAQLAGGTAVKTAADGLPKAFAECTKRASTFLGGDWRTGWVVLQPVLPGKDAWAGGARWFRCDVAETSPIDGALVHRSGSMKNTVKAGGKLRMGCANPTIAQESVSEMHPVACASSHTAEFAGLFVTTQKKSSGLTGDALAKGCDAAIATFAGLRNDSSVSSRVGWLGFPPDDTAWSMGDRAIRCFLWLNGEKMTGSYRNAGPGKLKIHYSRR